MISIIYITYRPGSFDVLVDSLINQTCKDYELIVVDDYSIDRKKEIVEYLRDKGVNVKCVVKSKPKCFPELSFNVENAVNTGIILSEGEFVALYQDYQWLEPDCLEKLINQMKISGNNYSVVLPARTWESYNSRNNIGNISIWNKEWVGRPENNNCEEKFPWIPEGWEWAFVCHTWKALENMNGYPECMDCWAAIKLEPLLEWMEKSGTWPLVDTNNFIHALNHREWEPAEMWHQARRTSRKFSSFVWKDNLFDLKTIKRGYLYWNLEE